MSVNAINYARKSTAVLESALETLDDSTQLYDDICEELDQRDHEQSERVSNGGVRP